MTTAKRSGDQLMQQAATYLKSGDNPGVRSATAACLTLAREAYRVEGSPKAAGIDSVRLNLLGHRGANDLFRAKRPA